MDALVAPLKNNMGLGGVWIYKQATPPGVKKKRVSGPLGVGCSKIEMRPFVIPQSVFAVVIPYSSLILKRGQNFRIRHHLDAA
jgi:hypothetical protein